MVRSLRVASRFKRWVNLSSCHSAWSTLSQSRLLTDFVSLSYRRAEAEVGRRAEEALLMRGVDALGLFWPWRGFSAGHCRRGSVAPRYDDSAIAAKCGESFVRTREHTGGWAAAGDRVLRTWLLKWRRRTAGRRTELAGHAPITQSCLGPPGPDRISRAVGAETAERDRLARASRRRHRAAARRTDADGPRLAPDRARCRYLADANAKSAAQSGRAGWHFGHRRCREEWEGYRPKGLDAAASSSAGGGRPRAFGGARFYQPSDQARAVPRGRAAAGLDGKDSAVVGAQ